MTMIPRGDPSIYTRSLYGCEAAEISEVVVLTPLDDLVEEFRDRVRSVMELEGFFRGFHGSIEGGRFSLFRSLIGSPGAGDCTYYLRFTPCRYLIYAGLIGGLQEWIEVGDIIVPTGAYRGEGASRYFVEDAYPAVADFDLLRKMWEILEEACKAGIKVHYGVIYTTDSFASETEEFLERWRGRNLIGIEMETSAIYTISRLHDLRALAVHVVSDNPVIGKTLFHTLSEEDKGRVKRAKGILVEAIVKLVQRISK